VTASSEYCVPGKTNSEGKFQIEKVAAGMQRLIAYGETSPGGPVASAVLPFEVEGAFEFAAPLVLPRFGSATPLPSDPRANWDYQSPQGLRLSLVPGAISLAPMAPPELRVAQVPVDVAAHLAPKGVQLIDAFVLDPIRSTIDPPATISFPPRPGLEPGTQVVFHRLDYATGRLLRVAGGTVDEAGRATSNPGEGLDELTWVTLSREL
jgi:hypothetical protein